MNLSCDHPNIQDRHPRSLTHLEDINSKEHQFQLIPKPTRRYLKKLTLKHLCCPDCESKEITYYGKSSIGTQKYLCKVCRHQFVAQFDALFPRTRRRDLFEAEFLSNIAATGPEKGCGRREFWEGARIETLQMLESQEIRVQMNKIIKSMPIQSDKEYRLLVEFAVHEAYGRVMA